MVNRQSITLLQQKGKNYAQKSFMHSVYLGISFHRRPCFCRAERSGKPWERNLPGFELIAEPEPVLHDLPSSLSRFRGSRKPYLASIVSLSGGALLANLVSVTLLVAETITIRR